LQGKALHSKKHAKTIYISPYKPNKKNKNSSKTSMPQMLEGTGYAFNISRNVSSGRSLDQHWSPASWVSGSANPGDPSVRLPNKMGPTWPNLTQWGSMVLLYMVSWIPSIYSSHVSIYIYIPYMILIGMRMIQMNTRLYKSGEKKKLYHKKHQETEESWLFKDLASGGPTGTWNLMVCGFAPQLCDP